MNFNTMTYIFVLSAYSIALCQTPVATKSSAIPPAQLTATSAAAELAIVTKQLADEYFLSGKRQQASIMYDKVKALLKDPANFDDPEFARFSELMTAEVEYRKLLVDNGLEFWGGDFFSLSINTGRTFTAIKGIIRPIKLVCC